MCIKNISPQTGHTEKEKSTGNLSIYRNAVKKMFSQKKKKSRGIWFLIPVTGLLLLGLWLNHVMQDDTVSEGADSEVAGRYQEQENQTQKTERDIPVYENYEYPENNPGTDTQTEEIDPELLQKPYDTKQDTETNKDQNPTSEASNAQKPEETESSAASGNVPDSFLAVLVNGMVVIQHYVSGAVVSEYTTDISEELLSDYDRKLLSEGIMLADETAMEEFLQDFEG